MSAMKLKKQKKAAPLKTADTHPYVSQLHGGEPMIHKSLGDCKGWLIKNVQDFDTQMKRFGATNAEEVLAALEAIGDEGGEVDEVLDVRTGLRFRVSIRKRS